MTRAPDRAKGYLNDAYKALQQAADAGISAVQLAPLQTKVDGGLDALYQVTGSPTWRWCSTFVAASRTSPRTEWWPQATARCGSRRRAAVG